MLCQINLYVFLDRFSATGKDRKAVLSSIKIDGRLSRFCSAMRRQSQGTRLNEGYELRVSWSPEELSKDSPEDIQQACEYDYLLCKEVAPNAPCWVTVHTDGEGGCVHVHATIANHDLVSGTAIAHGTDHATVKRKNDQLSREMGFTVVGPEPAEERTMWAERKEQFGE